MIDRDNLMDFLAAGLHLMAAVNNDYWNEEDQAKPKAGTYPIADDAFHMAITDDELFCHFGASTQLNDWVAVGDEGLRVLSLCTDVEMHEGTLMDDLLSAVAAQAARTAYTAVALALGLDPIAVEAAANPWEEDPALPSIGFEQFTQDGLDHLAFVQTLHEKKEGPA